MIRLATRSDIPQTADLICEFLQDNGSYQAHTGEIDANHVRRLVYSIIHQGYIWLLFNGPIAVGLLAAVREPNIWIPQQVSLRELVWYVKEEYRNSVGAGRLFVKFCQQGSQLLEQGEIFAYFTTKMTTTGDYDLERRGFRPTETLYMRDQEGE